jgi:hypothetical protein
MVDEACFYVEGTNNFFAWFSLLDQRKKQKLN